MKDVQNEVVESIGLNRVGLAGVKFPVIIQRKGIEREIIVTGNLYLDLPENQKGAHMSRFVEALQESLDFPQTSKGIEWLALEIANKTKDKNGYCTGAEVELEATRALGKDVYKLFGYANIFTLNNGKEGGKMMVGVELLGSSACPCCKELTGNITHNQRVKLKVIIETDGSRSAESLVISLMDAFSAPVKTLLKRPDEKALVEYMHSRPFFVEDIVRNAVEILEDIGHKGWCKVEATSYESIHPHNVFAMYEGELSGKPSSNKTDHSEGILYIPCWDLGGEKKK